MTSHYYYYHEYYYDYDFHYHYYLNYSHYQEYDDCCDDFLARPLLQVLFQLRVLPRVLRLLLR